jgi:putative peptidoglycan lipid II flippase
MTLVLTIPAAVGLMLLAQPIVRVLYQHGKFGPDATQATGLLLCLYAIGLPAYALIKLYVPTLYTLGRSWLPVSVSLAMIGAKVLINVMIWRAGWSYSWLALTTGLAACANAAITSLLLRREIGSLAQERIVSTTFKTLVGSAAMALACWVTGWGMSLALPGDALIPSIVRLTVQILVGLAVLFPLMAQLGVGEAQQLLGIGKRLLARVTGRAS